VASAIISEGFGAVGSVVSAVAGILHRMQDFARMLIEKLIELAERFIRWFADLAASRPEDAVLLILLVGYWLSPWG
jgi:F420-0:gamma-glutamyl ligase-like protein